MTLGDGRVDSHINLTALLRNLLKLLIDTLNRNRDVNSHLHLVRIIGMQGWREMILGFDFDLDESQN